MKKIFLLLMCVFILLCGCEKKEEIKDVVKDKEENKEEIVEEVDTYKDLNNTPIGIYSLQGNKLVKLTSFNTKLVIEKDINTFQLYPSNEDVIYLNNGFGQSFYDEYMKYNTNGNLKMGFNIKFTLYEGREVSYNIFSPNETFTEWNYLMNYLYDDYANRGKSFYSHVESHQVTPETLYTAFKMQASYGCGDIFSKIQFTVFTYDSEDDFLDNEYRGNSKYTLNICAEGRPCE
ncbi:MAG: hypothetical protein IJZ46_05790 [Bacilli bacterium]|nr:hypothetical protein [Bacilli bacterium]